MTSTFDRTMQRLLCRYLYGCDACISCPETHCMHCFAWGERFVRRAK